MRHAYVTALLICAGALTAGCSPTDPLAKYRLGPAKKIVGVCMSTMGGLRRWETLGRVTADAVVSRYDTTGRAYVNRLKLDMDFRNDRIKAVAQTGTGGWSASSDKSGLCRLKASGGGKDVRAELIGEMLGKILHRASGPMNLLVGGERVKGAKPARIGGYDVIRVGASGGESGAAAYYFDATSGLLRYVTCGADSPGKGGTITIYEYVMQPNGMAFPQRIRIMEIGQRAMISRKPNLEIEFYNVVMR